MRMSASGGGESGAVGSARNCWWCGRPADSREHKFKKSDLRREFGPGPYYGEDKPLRLSEGRRTRASGRDSPIFKFRATLCGRCNNERSQPFDNAYDSFVEYVFASEDRVLRERVIRLSAIYGDDWKARRDDLVRYFVKHISSRIAELDTSFQMGVNRELIAFLNGGPDPLCLELDLYIDTGFVRLSRLLRTATRGQWPGFVALDPVWGQLDTTTGALAEPQSRIGYRWLWLAWRVDGGQGFVSPFTHDCVHLRRFTKLPLRVRAALLFGQLRASVEAARRKLAQR